MRVAKSQKIWNYIRRNPIFRAGDIAIVTDIQIYTVSMYLLAWEKGGFITLAEDNTSVRNKVYKLKKKSVLAPARTSAGKVVERKIKEKKVIKDLQSKQERAEIAFTHAKAKKTKEKTNVKVKNITLHARLIRGQKGIGYSPTIFAIDDAGNIVCKDTGFIVDKMETQTGESYGYVCPRKGAA